VDRAPLREAAHAVLTAEVGATAVGRLCPRCGSAEHGRPYVVTAGAAPYVSLSYADGLVAVAWSYAGPVGVDVEVDGPPVDGTDRREWTRAEAAFKAGADAPLTDLSLPDGYLGTVAGAEVSVRLAGPGAAPR
jgi:4'-phosphopantetheinyl transferase